MDGGGSKIDVALVAADGSLIAAVRHRAFANFNFGHEPPLDAVGAAIDKVVARAGWDRDSAPVARAGLFCLAGADLPLDDRRIAGQVGQRRWVETLLLRNDTFAVLRAGTERGWGIGVVCGSGLNCAGIGPDGRVVRFPSLGELSGDLAHGGGWLGHAALGSALRARDGRGERTTLERLVPSHFGMARPQSVMEALYTGALDDRRMLELAPVVFKAARAGDHASRRLIGMLGDEVVATANAAIRRLHLTRREFDVVLGGGIFRSGDGLLMSRVRDGIKSVAPDASLSLLAAPPVVGAALLGLDALNAPAAAKRRVKRELTDARLRGTA